MDELLKKQLLEDIEKRLNQLNNSKTVGSENEDFSNEVIDVDFDLGEDFDLDDEEERELTDEEKHDCRYYLQYDFIPDMISCVERGLLSSDVLTDTSDWDDRIFFSYDSDFFFEWDQFSTEVRKINDNYLMVLYTFPEPREVPDAAYGAVVLNTSNNEAKYYTFEYSFGGEWMICSMKGKSHRNYGSLENPTKDGFVDWVLGKVKFG